MNCGPKLPPAGHSRVFVVPLPSPPRKKDTALSVFGIYAPLLISAIQPVSTLLCFPFGHLDGDPSRTVFCARWTRRVLHETRTTLCFFFFRLGCPHAKPPRTKPAKLVSRGAAEGSMVPAVTSAACRHAMPWMPRHAERTIAFALGRCSSGGFQSTINIHRLCDLPYSFARLARCHPCRALAEIADSLFVFFLAPALGHASVDDFPHAGVPLLQLHQPPQ